MRPFAARRSSLAKPRVVALLLVALVASPLAFATPSVTEAARLPFNNLAPMVAPANGALYVLGGLNQTLFDGVVKVDLATGSATNVSRLPVPLAAAGYATVGGITYTFGGVVPNGTSTKATDQIGRFDPATLSFTWMDARLPRPDLIAGAAWGDDAFYVMGGLGDFFNITRYDPFSDTVQQIPLPQGIAFYLSPVARSGDAIYVYGGIRYFPNGTSAWTTEIFRFSLDDHSVVALDERMPELALLGTAQTVGDAVHIFGGVNVTNSYRQTILRHRPDVGVVESIGASLPTGNILHASAVTGGKAYIVGGLNQTRVLDTVLALDAEYEELLAVSRLVDGDSLVAGETAIEGAPRSGDPRTYDVSAVVLGTRAPTVGVFTNGAFTQPVSVRPLDHDVAASVDAGAWSDSTTKLCALSLGGECLVWLPADPSDPGPALDGGRFRIGVDVYVDGERVNENVVVPLAGNALP